MAGEANEMDAHYTTYCDLKEAREKIKELNRRCQKAESMVNLSDQAILDRVLNTRQPRKPLGRIQANYLLMNIAINLESLLHDLEIGLEAGDPILYESVISNLKHFVERMNEYPPQSPPPSSGSSSS